MAKIPGPAYGIRALLSLPFDQALQETRAALKEEGFGILAEMDIRKAMQEKLGVEIPPYVILGACNPPLAHKALQAEREIGILLPCNVIVYEKEGAAVVSAMNPDVAMGIVANQALQEVASEARTRLQRAIDSLDARFG